MFPSHVRSQQTNSNAGSTLVTVKKTVIDRCGKALDELDLRDQLDLAKDEQIKLLNDRLDTEKKFSALAVDLADSRKSQATSLEEANNALHEAIQAKDEIIANDEQAIRLLKKRKTKLTTIFKAVGVGIGIGLLLK